MKNISPYLKLELKNEALQAGIFMNRCKAAALKDDGFVSKEEKAVLRKLERMTKRYIRRLERINHAASNENDK